MAKYETIVYLDISTPQGSFVSGLKAFLPPPKDIGPFIQGQAVPFRVYPVVPGVATEANPNPDYVPVSLSGLDFELVMGPRAGATAVLASVDGGLGNWTINSDGSWSAVLNLNTSAMNTAIGTLDSIATYLEFRISDSSSTTYDPLVFPPVAQISVTVNASVRDPSAAVVPPTPAVNYVTTSQLLSLCVLWNNQIQPNNWGRNVIFASPDGNRTRELGVDNNGSPVDNAT